VSKVSEAIVLAGGLGTRLREVIGDLPKPLAMVAGRPFLFWLLAYLDRAGLQRVLLSVGFRHEEIRRVVGTSFGHMRLEYVTEDEPCGTGGAISLALQQCRDSRVLCLNGDTYFAVDIEAMEVETVGADVAIALRLVDDVARFGAVNCEQGRIIGFAEKNAQGQGLISGGTYLLDRLRVAARLPSGVSSFEQDFLARRLQDMNFRGFVSGGYFIDIGVPESFARAQTELPRLESGSAGEA
jgi:D-glycero-alpha-D-manno-heptose 1-phosphate guanylyltransferase